MSDVRLLPPFPTIFAVIARRDSRHSQPCTPGGALFEAFADLEMATFCAAQYERWSAEGAVVVQYVPGERDGFADAFRVGLERGMAEGRRSRCAAGCSCAGGGR